MSLAVKTRPHFAIWQYRAVFTQTATGGGVIRADFGGDTGNHFELIFLQIGKDDYASSRNVAINLLDSDTPNLIATMLTSVATDNNNRIWPHKMGQTENIGLLKVKDRLLVGGDDILSAEALTPILNETLTVTIRAVLFGGTKPSISTSRSGGTVTITTTYDQVTG